MNKITAALARLDIPARGIQTRNLSVNRIDYGANKGRYEPSNSVAVRVRDNKRVSEALAAVTAAGATIVSGTYFSLAEPEKAHLGAYGTAYKAARDKAVAYAATATLPVTSAVALRDRTRVGRGKRGLCR